MKIIQSLPFDVCENCTEFVMDVKEQTYFSSCESQRIITVKCKHERKCKELKENLKKMEEKRYEQ